MTVKSILVEAEAGGAADLWCSHGSSLSTTDSRVSTTDLCTFMTPGNASLVMAAGAAYQSGRLKVLDGEENSCGLRIARVEEADFGVWR